MEGRESEKQSGPIPATEGVKSTGRELDRKFRIALVLYAVLAALAWFFMDSQEYVINGKRVDLRLLPLIVVGGLAFRTVLAHQADKIRRNGGKS